MKRAGIKARIADCLCILLWLCFKAAVTLAAMSLTAVWLIPIAAAERGYTGAVGGEGLIIAFAGFFTALAMKEKNRL